MKKIILFLTLIGMNITAQTIDSKQIAEIDRTRILNAADKYLNEAPVTITSFRAERSAGGKHDFYSEGDYWWPDPQNPDGPYIRRDGMTNPENFVAHRQALMGMSIKVAALTAAYKITGDTKYSGAAIRHILAWFANAETKMNPNLLYAQAIKGRFTGRGIGIIDTIHLVEVAQAIMILEKAGLFKSDELAAVKEWFGDYLKWITTHKYGIDERDNGNNHSTCWAMQVAEYAKFTGNKEQLDYCRTMFTDVLIPSQMAENGSFPKELARTKPYGYSLFNLDVMSILCNIISEGGNNFWNFKTADGKGMRPAIEFMYPFIKDKNKWPYQADVMYFSEWPVRQPSLLFAGIAYTENKYIKLWKTLDPDPEVEEVIRNFPLRQPVLWID